VTTIATTALSLLPRREAAWTARLLAALARAGGRYLDAHARASARLARLTGDPDASRPIGRKWR
jgi:hypothetical protein